MKQHLHLHLFAALFLFNLSVQAQTVLVTESNVVRQADGTTPTNNWVAYTSTGTSPNSLVFVDGPGMPPIGCGNLKLTTTTSSDKVYLFNYDHIGTKLSDIDNISYYTYRTAGSNQQVAVVNLQVDINGPNAPGGFTTLIFEPLYNTAQGTVTNNQWQLWNAINNGNAIWWSSRNIPGVCAFNCFVKWSDILAANPDATIVGGVGINQGTGNSGLVTSVDAFTFENVTYNFEASSDMDGDGLGDSCDNDDDGDGVNDTEDCNPNDKKNDKILICHNGKPLCVSINAVKAHLAHGDALGSCTSGTSVTGTNSFDNELYVSENFNLTVGPNPSYGPTRIKYSIPLSSSVAIHLFDQTGKEIKTVFTGMRKAGTYNVELNLSDLKEGIYYFRIIAKAEGKEFAQTQKLIKMR